MAFHHHKKIFYKSKKTEDGKSRAFLIYIKFSITKKNIIFRIRMVLDGS
jgi:hypothetical protein